MPATTPEKPAKKSGKFKNPPFDLPPALQREFNRLSKRLSKPRTELFRMALDKGLPIIREFLLGDHTQPAKGASSK